MIEIISDHKPTNSDRIRNMSDEELAKFITQQFCHGIGEKLILEWLQQQNEVDYMATRNILPINKLSEFEYFLERNKCGLRLLDMDNLLYPQYEYKFHSIDSDTWKSVQKEAANKIYESKVAHEKYLKDTERYRLDLDKFKEDVKKFELKHPEYPKYEDNPKFYEHLGCGTVEEWDKEKQKEETGFLFAPREPYDGAAHPKVVAHWKSIVNGNIPFGLRIED